MSSTIEKPAVAALPHLTVATNNPERKYSTDGTSTMADEKQATGLTRESTLSTPSSAPNPFDTDIEAMISSNSENCTRKSTSSQRPNADCQVWPGQEHWKKKAKAAKVKRSRCGCMAKMSKRNRILLHMLILVLIVGIGLSIGFGISKPINAPIPSVDNDQD